MIMETTDLIFQPFQIRCPKCQRENEISFEDLQYKEEIICRNCQRTFTPDINVENLLGLVRIAEAHLAGKDAGQEMEEKS